MSLEGWGIIIALIVMGVGLGLMLILTWPEGSAWSDVVKRRWEPRDED